MDRAIRLGILAGGYFDQINGQDLTEEDFSQWIQSVQGSMKEYYQEEGLEKCREVRNFKRFVLEMNDNGFIEYMKQHLSEDDFKYWRANGGGTTIY